ncbi:TPA: hypothetical protein R0445_004419 [Salmonella enterica subsp. enterica serovar Hvittingfoss]|nr:hypothetical protein [Salmonella enterica subsp. enterica serovar Hvittingfoss]
MVEILAKLNIRKLVGFKQITSGVITSDVLTALKRCGIDTVTSVSASNSEFSTGQMSVLGNTFYGLKISTAKGKTCGWLTQSLTGIVPGLEHKAVQMGFRLTQSAVTQSEANRTMLSFYSNQSISLATGNVEDSSVYYELVLSKNNNYLRLEVWVNKQLTLSRDIAWSTSLNTYLQYGSLFSPQQAEGYNLMVGDMYLAELDYNSDGTVTPQLLGNLALEPFTVATYSGDKHSNTKNEDIVTALNTLDPNNDMGVLAIKPVEQPASVTFNVPDITGKSIYGAALNIVYKDSIAPNNHLSYQITEGTTQLPAETITTRSADITGYTTFSKILTTPESGGAWNADNLKFKLDLVNKGAE